MKNYAKTFAVSVLSAALSMGAINANAALSFSGTKTYTTNSFSRIAYNPDRYERGTLSPYGSRSGAIQTATDIDTYNVRLDAEGILHLQLESSSPNLFARVYKGSDLVASLQSSAEQAKALKLVPGDYQVRVSRARSASDFPSYRLVSDFSNKPTRHALVVFLENGGINVDVQETVTNVDMLAILEQAAQQFSLTIDQAEQMLLAATDDGLEEGTENFIRRLNDTYGKYAQVIVLEDGSLTHDQALSTLDNLADDYVIDVHVLTHGADGAFVGQDETFGPSFFSDVSAIPGLYVRTVYQMNCYGSSLLDTWATDIDVEAVNGSVNINYMPPSYFVFLEEWMQGVSFDDAVRTGYEEMIPVADAVYEIVDIRDESTDTARLLVDPFVFFNADVVPSEEKSESVMLFSGSNQDVTVND